MKYIARATSLGLLYALVVLTGLEALRPGFLRFLTPMDWGFSILALAVLAMLVAVPLWLVFRGRWRRDLPKGRTWTWVPLTLIAILLAVALLSQYVSSASNSKGAKVVILGLDGAAWPIIDRLIEAGELPSFEVLKREGTSGVLRSDDPTLSPRVWTTIATGVDPSVHGAVDFFSTQDSIREPRIWEIVSLESGRSVGVWEWLLTWPPDQLDGFIVPGWLTRGIETQPSDLEFFQRLRRPSPEDRGLMGKLRLALTCYWHGVRLPTLVRAAASAGRLATMGPKERENRPDSTLVHLDLATDLFLARVERVQPTFSTLVLYATDSFAHQYWIDFDPQAFEMDEPWSDRGLSWVLPEAYRQADRTLGRLMAQISDKTILIVLSDHGTQANRDSYTKYSIRSEVLIRGMGMEGSVAGFSVGRLLQMREIDPDPERTKPAFVDLLEQAAVRGEPLFKVEAGTPPFYSVRVIGDPSVEDLATIGETQVKIEDLLFRREVSGDHTLDGILALWGTDVRPGGLIRSAGLKDIAPTVLTYLDLPLSQKMSGQVLSEVFTDKARSRLHPTFVEQYSFSVEDIRDGAQTSLDEDIRERLEALGYLE